MKINGIEYDDNLTLSELAEKMKVKGDLENYALVSMRTGNKVEEKTAEDILEDLE